MTVKAVQDADFQFLIRDSNLKNNAGFPTKICGVHNMLYSSHCDIDKQHQ